MRRGRGAQLDQVLQVLTLLAGSRTGRTLHDMAETVGLHERTIRRYLEDVASVYFPIECVDGEDGGGSAKRWRFVRGVDALAKLALRFDEALALARLKPIIRGALGEEHWAGPLVRLLDRITAAVPDEFRQAMDRLLLSFGVARPHAIGHPAGAVLREFEEASRSGHAVAVRYRSLGGRTAARRFDPYIIYVAEGTPYTYGRDHARGEERILALDRVLSVQPLPAAFVRPADFSVEQFLSELHRGFRGSKKLAVVLRCRGHAARLWTDRPELAGQVAQPLPHGEVRVSFSVPDSPALRAHILSFGAEVVVEAPDGLRQAVAGMHAAATAVYAAGALALGKPAQRKPLRRVSKRAAHAAIARRKKVMAR